VQEQGPPPASSSPKEAKKDGTQTKAE
jgi:hypothetical protein